MAASATQSSPRSRDMDMVNTYTALNYTSTSSILVLWMKATTHWPWRTCPQSKTRSPSASTCSPSKTMSGTTVNPSMSARKGRRGAAISSIGMSTTPRSNHSLRSWVSSLQITRGFGIVDASATYLLKSSTIPNSSIANAWMSRFRSSSFPSLGKMFASRTLGMIIFPVTPFAS